MSTFSRGEGLNWNPASVELPEIPTIPPGEDALSATIAAVLPTLGVPLAANVATLQAKEGTFAGKVTAAEAAYQTGDDSGSQSVGQVVSMLGQMGQQAGQMGQMAGAPAQAAGQGVGMFGSLIQQAMQAGQGGAGEDQATGEVPADGQPAPGGAPVGTAQTGASGQQPPRGEGSLEQRVEHLEERAERDDREPLLRADDSRPSQGAVPVTPPEQPRPSEKDLGRSL